MDQECYILFIFNKDGLETKFCNKLCTDSPDNSFSLYDLFSFTNSL